jgi:hypothetical protein
MGWTILIVFFVVLAFLSDIDAAKRRKRVDEAYNGFNPEAVHGHRKFPTDAALKKAGLI